MLIRVGAVLLGVGVAALLWPKNVRSAIMFRMPADFFKTPDDGQLPDVEAEILRLLDDE